MKRLFLLLIFSLIGVIANPSILIANQVEDINSPEFNAVETIIEPEVVETPNTEIIETEATHVAPVITVPANNITIAGRSIPLIQTSSTEVVYDNAASKYGENFIYGHNTGNVFGLLYVAWAGQTFSVTMDGATKNYIISDIVIYEKNQSNGLLQINGHGNYMNSVAAAIKKTINETTSQVDLTYYDLSIMTCYGTMLGGGDATHRLVVFAYEI
ncbi:hypothetical protein IKG10_02355 [Candidatus Saccharibacteria bacterium]|nr:hypothetical protein [Candidatus Saccharibacteria bacterium]